MNSKDALEWRGDHIPISTRYQDIYFDIENGLEESRYVFIEGNQLLPRFQELSCSLAIGELGFGTGLNFFATAQTFLDSGSSGRLIYTSCEQYPLSSEAIRKSMQAFPELETLVEEFLEYYTPIQGSFLSFEIAGGRIRIQIFFGEALEFLNEISGPIDAWYFDGFSPKKNPEMWRSEIFSRVSELSHSASTFSTFSSAGFVRRSLQENGARVTKRRGFGRKREMCHGVFERLAPRSSRKWNKLKVGIVGSGIAAAELVKSLEYRNIEYQIFESKSQAASGASGNPLALVMPFLASSSLTRVLFSSDAFNFQRSRFKDFHLTGIRQLFKPERKAKQLFESLSSIEWPDSFLNADRNEITFLKAGVYEAKKLLSSFWNDRILKVHCDFQVISFLKQSSGYRLQSSDGRSSDVFSHIIFANAFGVSKIFPELREHISRSRGQILELEPVSSIQSCLSFGKYITPTINGTQILGGTYRHDNFDESLRADETEELLTAVKAEFNISPSIRSGRASERCNILGNWPSSFWSGDLGFLFGFGSRAFTESALCAENMVSQLTEEILPISTRTRLRLEKLSKEISKI